MHKPSGQQLAHISAVVRNEAMSGGRAAEAQSRDRSLSVVGGRGGTAASASSASLASTNTRNNLNSSDENANASSSPAGATAGNLAQASKQRKSSRATSKSNAYNELVDVGDETLGVNGSGSGGDSGAGVSASGGHSHGHHHHHHGHHSGGGGATAKVVHVQTFSFFKWRIDVETLVRIFIVA